MRQSKDSSREPHPERSQCHSERCQSHPVRSDVTLSAVEGRRGVSNKLATVMPAKAGIPPVRHFSGHCLIVNHIGSSVVSVSPQAWSSCF